MDRVNSNGTSRTLRRRAILRGIANAVALPLLLTIGLAGNAEKQAAPSIGGQEPRPYQLSVNVHLVVLNATVRDPKGRFASELNQENFEIYEDGVRQTLRLFRHEDIPVTVGLVVDHSGSMRQKLAEVIAAARTFAQSSSSEDEMFVVNFNEHVSLGLPAAIRFTNRPEELARAISNTPARGQTALYDAMVEARKILMSGSRDKKVLIVISDGGDNKSVHSLAEILKMSELSSVLVYTIGIFDDADLDQNPKALRSLAQATGGEAFFPGELSEVVSVCERIARDIRHQYTLGYVSSNTAQTETYRTIKVVARVTGKGKLAVRTRSGYIAGGEPAAAKNEGLR